LIGQLSEKEMMNGAEFCELLKTRGFDFFTGVPCSILKDVISVLERDPQVTYVPAVREDTAVGLASGAYMAGRRPMVLMQNSGLGVCMNALTSLALIYKIPLLMLITWRGYQGKDAPEHLVMGRVMLDLLDDIGVAYRVLEPASIEADLDAALITLAKVGTPVALVLRKGVLA
jgi:phosphonopyruvate decarboxylase